MAIRSARNYLGDELIRTAPRIKSESSICLKGADAGHEEKRRRPNLHLFKSFRSEHGPS